MNLKPNTIMKTFEERYPEHNNPEWQIRTWSQEEDLERAKSEHETFIRQFNELLIQ
tara:strand:+ start:432 stop:599 length:168 start_codon:yes stop_codon:yes gene_type:complete